MDRFGLYIHRDNQDRKNFLTIQPVKEKGCPNIIHAPYTVRPWFAENVKNIAEKVSPLEFDVTWLGSESYKMVNEDSMTRHEYLNRFEDAICGRFKFNRQHKVHNIQEYAHIMKRSKICIHIHGLAESCFRYWETLHLNSCLVAQRFEREIIWDDPGDIVPTFKIPEEAAELCASLISSGGWEKIRQQQQTWYDSHHSDEVFFQWGKDVANTLFP